MINPQPQTQSTIQQVFSSQQSIQPLFNQDQFQIQGGQILSFIAEYHIQFLRTLKRTEKAFRIECTIISETGISTILKKTITQTNQKSEMNVISN